ncbi:hypothetical protein NV379_17525 [Paenibacillus sp. N1-5-1-14]|uniref:hypothetical protein n=1 Tax=Paenibacillus radicibacter TaxID=2972488 RepID=UPI002159AE04|nr:hypothetical protein [Paenibacillus radicibacter]MCR8644458.1 hypothetical protein [Paenibacillus radicibacter]
MNLKHRLILLVASSLLGVLIFMHVSDYGVRNLWGMPRLEMAQVDLIQTSKGQELDTFLAKNIRVSDHDRLSGLLEGSGWKLDDQLGSAYIFTKEQQRTIVTLKKLSREYVEIKVQME